MNETLFETQLKKKILVLDGAMGTMIQEANLTEEDFGGEQYDGCNEYLNLIYPGVIKEIHEKYLAAGADIIETNTFGATAVVLDEYGLGSKAEQINIEAARIAKDAANAFSTEKWPRFVAGSMGPTTKTLSVTGGISFEELIDNYEEQARGLIIGGADVLLLETSQDMLNVKAGFIGIERAFKTLQTKLPLLISGTIEPMGTTLAGQNIEAFYVSLEHMKPVAVGINCATGPEFMVDHIRSLSALATTAVSCYPNAGLPDEDGHYHETPESLARKISSFAEKGWVNLVGGCCGTTPDHIRAIADAVRAYSPRAIPEEHHHAVSGTEPLIYDESMRPLMVGERTNVIGSRKFKRLISEGKFEEASEIARAQVKAGAHVIDICLADPDRDEESDMELFIQETVKKVKVPIMIDSTDEKVFETALKYIQGKVIINSINLEDGEERFAATSNLIHRFGGAVVVGTIDETGMGVTAEKKLEIAERSYDLLVNKYGIHPSDIIFDLLVFPVGTGDAQYIGSAQATVEGIKLVKERFPECKTILGVSNVSFGLPPVGREVLNAVFLYHCTKAGLDYAIVNTEKLERFASISEKEREMSEDLLFQTRDEILAAFTAFYRDKKEKVKKPIIQMTLEQRLANYVVEGTKEGLLPDLEVALGKYDNPLEIINGPLMAGMSEVGRLFDQNQLIVAEVLQSAEVMKTAVSFLEPYMEKKDDSGKGKILLATVKGDVHDIGKNLVEIILGNNGFQVVDLGIKVTPQQLIEAIEKERPDMVGLSGLLVKSAQQMVLTAQDLTGANISVPILVGGAALTRSFTDRKIAAEYDGLVLYAKDAMSGLAIANKLQNDEGRDELLQEQTAKKIALLERDSARERVEVQTEVPSVSKVSKDAPVFTPPDLDCHILKNYPISLIEPYINQQTLLGSHLGLKGRVSELLQNKDGKALQLKDVIDTLLFQAKEEKLITTNGIYQFFPAQSQGNDILIYSPNDSGTVIERFSFPRMKKDPFLCLADFVKPVESGQMDYVGFFIVSAGRGIRENAQIMKENGDYLKSHALQSLALELAEGFAERLHHVMRDSWGFPDSVELTMKDRLSARYQGVRVSFGYPACPNLEDQAKLFKLLSPEEIGVQLTEGYMMEPEASVSAMVFAHPEGRYFMV